MYVLYIEEQGNVYIKEQGNENNIMVTSKG